MDEHHMPQQQMPDAGTASGPGEAPYVSQVVDRTPNAATEADEMAVLEDLYGPCDEAGFFTGEAKDEAGAPAQEEDRAHPAQDAPEPAQEKEA